MTESIDFDMENARAAILADPSIVLDSIEVMRALASAAEFDLGDNVVDMRGLAMKALESKLRRLEDTQRRVVAASYENLTGIQQTQRAVIAMVEQESLDSFCEALSQRIPELLKLACVRLLVEMGEGECAQLDDCGPIIACPPGSIADYLEVASNEDATKPVLRQIPSGEFKIYGEFGLDIRSEALVPMIDENGRYAWLLVLGSSDRQHYNPKLGTDLLEFFGAVFLRVCRRWLP